MLADRAPSAVFVAALIVGGCSAPVVDDGADAGDATTQAVVLVERVEPVDGSAQTNVSAKFLRIAVAAEASEAERVLGTRLELPARESCDVLVPAQADASTGLEGAIELLDVGNVTLRVGPTVAELAPRAFPDVGDLVSGVFYTSRDAAVDLPGQSTYFLEGTGSGAIEHFSIELDAPALLDDVRLGAVPLAETTRVQEGEPLHLSWSADGAGVSDLVYVDVGAESGLVVRCAFGDTGEATIAGALLRSDVLGASPQVLHIGVHRVRQSAFSGVTGIEVGEARFDLGSTGRVTIDSAAR